MAAKKTAATGHNEGSAPENSTASRKRWTKLSPKEHVLKQIELQRKLVADLREQLQKEAKTLEGMEKAKEFFPA